MVKLYNEVLHTVVVIDRCGKVKPKLTSWNHWNLQKISFTLVMKSLCCLSMQQNPHYTMFFKKITLLGPLYISQKRKDIVNFQLYLH